MAAREVPVRMLVVWCPDWPVVAAGRGPGEPAAVVTGGQVVACSAAARASGVRRGQRRRHAEGCCPDVEILAADPDRDARAFEAVAASVEELTPGLEIVRPGTLALPTRGPSRYFGGDTALAARAVAAADEALGYRGGSRSGVADGLFAALLAARRGLVVGPGAGASFLAPLPVSALETAAPALAGAPGDLVGPAELAELVRLFRRLGLRTLGDLASVPPADLLGRFGPSGARISRLCRGLDERRPRIRSSRPELTVSAEIEPPAQQVEAAAFVARTLAADLASRLAASGLACARVSIEAETEHGEILSRRWRTEGLPLAAALAERARWQLDGWCNGAAHRRPTGGLSLLRLVPEEVGADRGRQLGFWGGATAADERAARGMARLQGLLGPEAVTVPRRRGGRGPGDQVVLITAASVGLGAGPPTGPGAVPPPAPWPGRLPAPSPALVHDPAVPAEVLGPDGTPVAVTGRGVVTAEPTRVTVAGSGSGLAGWAGPWPVDERWWDEAARCRLARIQVVTAAGHAHLLALHGGRWTVEATYD